MKYAIVDLGSNTIRLSVYRILEDRSFVRLFSEKETAGLGSYVTNGIMSREGIEKACSVLLEFRELLEQFDMKEMHVFATASLRNIQNTDEALQLIYRNTGLEVEVISGREEAKMGYYGALYTTHLQDGFLFDIGGGSTEVAEIRHGEIHDAQSMPLGSLSLFNAFVSKIWPKDQEIEDIKAHIDHCLTRAEISSQGNNLLCGIAGTSRAVLKITNAYYGKTKQNQMITPKERDEITEVLCHKNGEARRLILGQCPDRVHTIIPGILLMQSLCHTLGGKELFISKYGVREGYLCRRFLTNTI